VCIPGIFHCIDPLFLDDLKSELAQIKIIPVPAERTKKLKQYQQKLAGLTFLENCTTSLIRIAAA
jgi:hypothetical protein